MLLFRKKEIGSMKKTRICTLTIVARPSEWNILHIALAPKIKRLCKGKLAFPGGRVEETDSSIRSANKRELKEEFNIRPERPGEISFSGIIRLFIGKSSKKPSIIIHVFWLIDHECKYRIKTNNELGRPRWFTLRRMPWQRMMPADRFWFRSALASLMTGLRFREDIWYNKRKTKVLRAECYPFPKDERVR